MTVVAVRAASGRASSSVPKAGRGMPSWPWALASAALVLAVWCGLRLWPSAWALEPVKFYPVVVNAVLLWVFAASLRQPVPFIERLARRDSPYMLPHARRYVRRLTGVWCVFFAANGLVAVWTALQPDAGLWAFYNGVLSYLLVGALLVGERLFRRHAMADAQRYMPEPLWLPEAAPASAEAAGACGGSARALLKVGDLPQFDGHFDGAALLPGVTLIDWGVALGRARFAIAEPLAGIPRAKFMRPVLPGADLEACLLWLPAERLLHTAFRSAEGLHAEVRLTFQGAAAHA